MRLFDLACLFILFVISYTNDLERYRPFREQCQRTPSNPDCLKIKTKFIQLNKKCQKTKAQQETLLCQQVKAKLCAVFPSDCIRKSTKSKLITTTITSITNKEFIEVPINPDELRTRGEYCIRHGKEKKCQDLLNNLKKTYLSCNKNKPQTSTIKSEQLDCHSFQIHLCKAFPKFPPCIKKYHNQNSLSTNKTKKTINFFFFFLFQIV